jgi:5-methylcytosine-specific restriction endonuclease McrA
MTKICSRCGKEKDKLLFSLNCRRKDGRNNICKKCMAEKRRIRIAKSPDKVCRICGKSFKSEKMATTCSMKCRGIAESANKIEKVCLNCGKSFLIRENEVNNRPVRGTYCSARCRMDHLSQRISGEKHGCWRGGHRKYRGPNWRPQRRRALARDNNKCVLCGKSADENESELIVHHKIPFRFFDGYKKANLLSNLMTLCSTCHAKQKSHWWKKVPQSIKSTLG